MEAPLLDETVEGAVDYKGNPASRFNSGGWRSASIIIGVEIAERFALFGTSSNLINFLTYQLQQSTATAAKNVNAWSGTAALLPLLGAFLADCVLGQYRTIVLFTALYVLLFVALANYVSVLLFIFNGASVKDHEDLLED
uniref:Uncharacterized protein n=1 Tax=Cucumis sativus TaxID=3659 RepID=A0A0A0KKU1_CUCSA